MKSQEAHNRGDVLGLGRRSWNPELGLSPGVPLCPPDSHTARDTPGGLCQPPSLLVRELGLNIRRDGDGVGGGGGRGIEPGNIRSVPERNEIAALW